MDEIKINKLNASWTKYDIVQVLDCVHDSNTLDAFYQKKVSIDLPILKKFLCVKDLEDPLPPFWDEVMNLDMHERKLFALINAIFMHHKVIDIFIASCLDNKMQGTFDLESVSETKMRTNIRSALVESGASSPIYRKEKNVPFNFSPLFYNIKIGPLFKIVLSYRIHSITKQTIQDDQLYQICSNYKFHKALGISKSIFTKWMKGQPLTTNYIKSIKIKNFLSIPNISLDFESSKEIYFLGENGDGKSLILMAIYIAFNGRYILEDTENKYTGKAIDLIKQLPNNVELEGLDESNYKYNKDQANYLKHFFAYGTHRGRYSTENSENYGFMTLFDNDLTLINPISWLKDLKLAEKKGSTKYELTTAFLEKIFHELLERNVKIEIRDSDVFFIEKELKLSFDQLSEGYRSIILFVSDLLYRLTNKGTKKVESIKGTVLVDEIDLHLHPKWQRNIISKLRLLFPKIQFIFTTHSPVIIQGAGQDAIIYRVNRKNGETVVSEPFFRKDLENLMINTVITSPLFGLENAALGEDVRNIITDDTYVLYRLNKKIEAELEIKRRDHVFISTQEIDDVINQVFLEFNDQD